MVTILPEPQWGTSQIAMPGTSALCTLGPTPFLLTGILIRLLQYHFCDPNNIDTPQLKPVVWTQNSSCADQVITITDPDTGEPVEITIPPTKIWIDVEFSESMSDTNRRPAIFVRREPVTAPEVSIRNDVVTGVDPCTNTIRGQKKLKQSLGSHSLICVGNTGAEADILGQEVYFRMLQYAEIIRDDFSLGAFSVASLGSIQEKDMGGGKKSFYTVVSLHWSYVYRWLVVPIAPVVRRTLLAFLPGRSC